jgi:hypothetical protein
MNLDANAQLQTKKMKKNGLLDAAVRMLVSLRFIQWNLIPNVIGITFWEVIKS